MASLTPQLRSGGRRSVSHPFPAPGKVEPLSSPAPLLDPGFSILDAEQAAPLVHSGRAIALEASFRSGPEPDGGDHLPRAIRIHPSYLESGTRQEIYYPNYARPEDGNLLPAPELHRALERLGIGPESSVVVCGRGEDGTMAAARVVWGLLYAGVSGVALLDGGWEAWRETGAPTAPLVVDALEGGVVARMPSAQWRVRGELVASTREVKRIVRRPDRWRGAKLVDVRRPDEWDGRRPHHYPFFAAAGHIPGALYQGDWRNLIQPATQALRPRLAEVESRWRDAGILDSRVEAGETSLVFYCGTGWRSSVGFLAAVALGLRAKNYDDGFYGWTTRGRGEAAG